MPKKTFFQTALHTIFDFLPQKILCLFGTCKEACGNLAMEDDFNSLKSVKLKVHLSVCRKCWNYSRQMNLINQKIVQELKSDVDSGFAPEAYDKSVEALAARFSKKS